MNVKNCMMDQTLIDTPANVPNSAVKICKNVMNKSLISSQKPRICSIYQCYSDAKVTKRYSIRILAKCC